MEYTSTLLLRTIARYGMMHDQMMPNTHPVHNRWQYKSNENKKKKKGSSDRSTVLGMLGVQDVHCVCVGRRGNHACIQISMMRVRGEVAWFMYLQVCCNLYSLFWSVVIIWRTDSRSNGTTRLTLDYTKANNGQEISKTRPEDIC